MQSAAHGIGMFAQVERVEIGECAKVLRPAHQLVSIGQSEFYPRSSGAHYHVPIWTEQSRTVTLSGMARPKEFDRETTLQKAIGVFCEHGYEGTSTDALLRAMEI